MTHVRLQNSKYCTSKYYPLSDYSNLCSKNIPINESLYVQRQRHGGLELNSLGQPFSFFPPSSCKLNFSWGLPMPRIKGSNQIPLRIADWRLGNATQWSFQGLSCLGKLESKATAGRGVTWASLRHCYLACQLQGALHSQEADVKEGKARGALPTSPTLLLRWDEGSHS